MVEAEDIFSLKLTVTKVAEQHILNVGDILTITKNGLLGKEDKGNKVFFGKNKECQVPFDVEDNTLFADYQAMIYYSEEENLNGYVIKCLSTVAPLSPTKIKINPGDKHALNKDDWLLLGWHYGFVVTDIGPMKGMAAEEGSGVYNVGQSVVKATSLLKGSYMSGKESPFIHIKWVDGPEELIKAPNYSKYWPYPGCPVTPLVMGRAAQGINYPIRYPESEMFNELSRIHCKVDYDENIGWFITEDAPVSTNGTFFSMKQYSDAYLEGRQNVLIGDEWEIYMGNNGFKVIYIYIYLI